LANLALLDNNWNDYALEGPVWFQCLYDMIDPRKAREQVSNLLNLIQDILLNFEAPTFPFIVAALGIETVYLNSEVRDEYLIFRKTQQSVVYILEFPIH
jgi:hypothetical protein